MSESLAGIGREGAEVIAGILNTFFDRMLGIASWWGGDCLKFGGDAMLLYFDGPEHAANAVAAGLEMQEAMRDFRRVKAAGGEYPLRMRIGAHSGPFLTASVGLSEQLLHYFVTGATLNRAAIAEAEGEAGRVVITAETAMALAERARLTHATSAGLLRVVSIDAPERPKSRPSAATSADGTLSRYVHPAVLSAQPSTFSAGHRRASIVFINLSGLSELFDEGGTDRVLPELDRYMRDVIELLEKHHGFLIGTDAAEDGDKIMAAFGAPIAIEGSEGSAARFAADLERANSDTGSGLRHRIGINTGFVFGGEVGGRGRREYTTIGDEVNLAARLMANASFGEVVVSCATLERVPGAIHTRTRSLRVKGKQKPVRAARLKGVNEAPRSPTAGPAALVGRERELSMILKEARRAAGGRARWLLVRGDPGIGKSALAADAGKTLHGEGWKTIAAYCQSHMSSTPFAPWGFVLRKLAGIEPGEEPGRALRKVVKCVRKLSPENERFAPLICDLMGLPTQHTPFLQSLDVESRRRHRSSLIGKLLDAVSDEQPLLVLFEDIHWSDEPSVGLLGEVIDGLSRRVLIVCTSRSVQPSRIARTDPALDLILGPLSPADARDVAGLLGEFSDASLEMLVERAAGNPLFIRELGRAGAIEETELPDNVSDVILARLDSLPETERAVLRLASIIGPSFAIEDLEAITSYLPGMRTLRRSLDDLLSREFLRPVSSRRPTLAFIHALAQAATYETLPFAERRLLHARFADHVEEANADRIETMSELLLHHYERADDNRRVALYAAISGDRAANVFANREAVGFYERAFRAAKDGGGGSADRSLILERIGDCLEMAGDHRGATEAFAQALAEYDGAPSSKPRMVPWQAQPRIREAELSRKAGVSCERASDYDGALHWLDRASSALPSRPGRLGPQIFAAKSVSMFRKGEYAEGVHWGQRAVDLARRTSGSEEDLAYAHSMLANSYIEQGLLRDGINQLRPALRIYKKLDAVRGVAVASNNLGSCYQLVGDMAAAHKFYEAALEAYSKLGDEVDAAIVHNNLGEVLLVRGEVAEANQHLVQVTEALGAGADVAAVAGLAYVNLSRSAIASRYHGAADRYLRRGRRLLRDVGAQGLLLESLIQLAELRLVQGNAWQSRRHASRAVDRAIALEARLLQARGERVLGSACTALGRMDEAKSALLSGLERARQLGADHEEALAAIAFAHLACHDPGVKAEAKRALRRAGPILRRLGARNDSAEAEALMKRLAR